MSLPRCTMCGAPAGKRAVITGDGETAVDLCDECATLPPEEILATHRKRFEGVTIDAVAEVSRPAGRELAAKRAGQIVLAGRIPAAHFGPAAVPEMRGRRPSGRVFAAHEVSPEMRGVPMHADPPFACSKRTAKGVAEELTKRPVQLREINGQCEIEVVFPLQRLAFHGRTWFLALGSLKDFLDKPHAFR